MEEQERGRLNVLLDSFLYERLEKISFGNPQSRETVHKVRVRPIMLRQKLVFQVEELRGKQVFHKNLPGKEAKRYFIELLEKDFRQCELVSLDMWAQILVSKKGTVTIKKKVLRPEKAEDGKGKAKEAETVKTGQLQHNRTKHYILEEGVTVPFLVDLGVMSQEGKIIQARYDKFRQINRFLEFIEDILPRLSRQRENIILDFGCGKSYLTFAMYYYLKEQKGYPLRIIGLDLKNDVIEHCNQLSRKYGYDGLDFYPGDIASFDGVDRVDMVVSLHACDTATDYALAKAVSWGAKVILAVPCCQHELNGQIDNVLMKPMLSYGLLKERLAALYTDGLRAELLEFMGYRTQILEFIDMEHTPKNLLIRGMKEGERKQNQQQIRELLQFWNVEPTLVRLLAPELLEK